MTPREPLRFSVVINTFNRLPFLRDALRSLRQQTYPHFEVVVVNGPSSDGTREFLARHADELVVVDIPDRNLSRSRNAGIRAAVGDVVAFIDDDAVADPRWLEMLALAYAEEDADAVGGFVWDHTGYAFQSRYLYCDRLGNITDSACDEYALYNFPFSMRFPYLMGTNASFRRAVLHEVGGFDEVFAWFYDESELCLRLNDAGFRIVSAPRALVYHRYAPSHLRGEARVPKTYFLPARSTAYFAHRNGIDAVGFSAVCDRLASYRSELERWAAIHHDNGSIDAEQRDRLIEGVRRGIDAGYEESRLSRDRRVLERTPHASRSLMTHARELPADGAPLHICLLSTEYPTRPCGGIGRYLRELARGLADLGHHVHVMIPGELSTVDYLDGVYVHNVKWDAPVTEPLPDIDLPPDHLRNSLLLHREVERVDAHYGVDFVLAPIWDHPGIVSMLSERWPFALTLHSTHKIILEENGETLPAAFVRDVAPRLIAAERLALERSPRIVANSSCFARHVESLYGTPLGARVVTIHHGLDDRAGDGPAERPGGPLRVLFVGRFEHRKGIDLLLDAIPRIAAALGDTVEFHLAGEDKPRDRSGETFRAEFMRRHGALVEHGTVRFHGVVSDDELDRLYRTADLMVAPSRFESFGLIYIEGMMYGLPVIAVASGAAQEIFRHGEDGFLVEETSGAALADAMLALLRRPEEMERLGRNARAAFRARFTRERMARAFAEQLRRWKGE